MNCDLDKLTYGQIKELQRLFGGQAPAAGQACPFEVGEKYFIRTVTMAHTGQVRAVVGNFLVLEKAAWIADTGRFSVAMRDQDKFSEVEMFADDIFVNIETIIDATRISKLPAETK